MNSVRDTACAVGCPIRKSTDQSLLAAPHGLSQRAASFIASQCQGIHQMPFRRLILFSGCATRRGKPRRTHNTARCIRPPTNPLAGAGPRSVLGHLTIVFTLSMIPLHRVSAAKRTFPCCVSFLRISKSPTLASTPAELVEADGIEPTTSCLQSRRSPN